MMPSCMLRLARMLLQPLDLLDQLQVLLLDLVAFEAGQALQSQVENRLGLDLAESEALHEALARGGAVRVSA